MGLSHILLLRHKYPTPLNLDFFLLLILAPAKGYNTAGQRIPRTNLGTMYEP